MSNAGRHVIRDEPMDDANYEKLLEDTERALNQQGSSVAFIGWTTTAQALLRDLKAHDTPHATPPIFDPAAAPGQSRTDRVQPLEALAKRAYDFLVVTYNENKEDVIQAALPYIQGAPKILVSGYDHYEFRDRDFHEILLELKVPSLANGYPNTQPHLYQCLRNAARLQLKGVVAEFGAFQGGTTMFLAKAIRRLGQDWPIFAFDTFEGFPPRRHAWDMYDHEDLNSNNYEKVKQYLRGMNVTLIKGDIVDTAQKVKDHQFVLTFIDTDNYSPAIAALDVVQERTVVGGAIVFDHYAGHGKFRYTLGERLAASRLEKDSRYFNLHGTGVFLRQR